MFDKVLNSPIDIGVKLSKNGPNKIFGRQLLKNVNITSNFLKSILEYLDPDLELKHLKKSQEELK